MIFVLITNPTDSDSDSARGAALPVGLLRHPPGGAGVKRDRTTDTSRFRIGVFASSANVSTSTVALSTEIPMESLANFEDVMNENDFSLGESVREKLFNAQLQNV